MKTIVQVLLPALGLAAMATASPPCNTNLFVTANPLSDLPGAHGRGEILHFNIIRSAHYNRYGVAAGGAILPSFWIDNGSAPKQPPREAVRLAAHGTGPPHRRRT